MVDTGRSHRPHAAHSADPRSRSRQRRSGPTTTGGLLREAVLVLVVALVLASVLRAFVVQAFVIPSGSMEDTLQCSRALDPSCESDASDRVVVSKLNTRLGGVDRGDVVVFEDPDNWLQTTQTLVAPTGPRGALRRGLQFVGLVPNDAQGHLIKRVVGIAGDRVQTDAQGRVRINGQVLDEGGYLKPGVVPSVCSFDVTVPPGSLFVLGDNRPNSGDSRYHLSDRYAGMVPVGFVTGRAVARVWPLSRIGGLGVPATYDDVPGPTAASTAAPAFPAANGASACSR